MTATYTMDDFINNKLAVRVNENNMMTFLKMCEEKGLVWNSGIKATSIVPSQAKCIAFGLNSSNTLTYSIYDRSDVYASDGYIFVNFSQIVNPKYQIIIESDGNTTTAKMVVDGKEVKAAIAKRNPADKANWHIGAQTAFDRLWKKQEKPEKEEEYGGFKIGDRVIISDGTHGTVVTLKRKDEGWIGVELDARISTHDCRGSAKNGYGWWATPDLLTHEQPAKQRVRKVKRRAKAGEYIELINGGYTFDKIGQIMRVNKVNECALVLQKDHPAFDAHSNPNFTWAYGDWEYVVLEGYQP